MSAGVDKLVKLLRDSWRSRWWGVLAAAIVCLLGWLTIFLLPEKYEARASVYVNTASKLAPVLNGLAVERDIGSQVELVKQLLLSKEMLETVAQDASLYRANATEQEKAVTIADLRERIILTGGRTSRDNLYTITFRDRNRATALAVVGSLLDHFIKRTIGTKRGYSDSAERFLTSQKEEYEKRLSAAETSLAEFKRKNMGLLPGDRLDYFGKLQQEIDLRNQARDKLTQLQMQRDQIKRQMSGESPVTALPASGGGDSASDRGGTGGTNIDRRIADAENRLNQMRLQWTDSHPEVIAQRELLERLRQERTEYFNSLGVDGKTSGPVSIESNPVYNSLRIALSQLDLKVFELNAEISSRNGNIAQLQRLAGTLPQVEAEYQQLNRGYTVMKEQYEEVVKRLEKARLSGEAEHSEDVDFRIIEPAMADARPVFPKRLLLLPAVLVAALGIGAWVALMKSALDPVLYSVEDLLQITRIPMLGAVGFISPQLLRAQQQRATWSFVGALVLFIVALGGVLAFELMRTVASAA